MKYLYFLLIFISFSNYAYGQGRTPDCKCPVSIYAGARADTIFRLTDNNSIALCGSRDTETVKGRLLYSEFVLSACGSDKIIKFWGAVEVCNIRTVKDTLVVESLVNLPVGRSMSYVETVATIEHIYFDKGTIVRDSVINSRLPRYNETQISNILRLYNEARDENDDYTSDLADKLFICTISNNAKARHYLVNFIDKFTKLDGVYLEYYDTVIRLLKLWDESKANNFKAFKSKK